MKHMVELDTAGATSAPMGTPCALRPERGGQEGATDGDDLIARLLEEQQELTAVDAFLQILGQTPQDRAHRYRRLMPAAPPGPGQQYAFEVDLDRCSGCKACATACHALNGLDEHETWRDVGLLLGGSTTLPVMQHVTTACHHCLEPACLAACPVDAYEKDASTGIVRHLDDQCIGCQYCTFACPYDVPKYHVGKGIVRKCDMCRSRLLEGEAPACVQACPHEAIAIRIVDRQQIIEDAEGGYFLPAAPDPQITLPATHYRTERTFPRNMLPADYFTVRPQHPHWPLMVMLALTQLSVGAFWVGLVLDRCVTAIGSAGAAGRPARRMMGAADPAPPAWLAAAGQPYDLDGSLRAVHASGALAFGLLALAASLLHLGRPRYAYRAVIGLRHSWLSREIVAFTLFAAAACGFAAHCWAFPANRFSAALDWSVALSGAAAVFCSAMVYAATGREWWSFGRSAGKFLLTAIILGIASTWLLIAVLAAAGPHGFTQPAGPILLPALAGASAGKLAVEAWHFRHLLTRRQTPLKRTAQLLVGPLARSTTARFACGIVGGVAMPLLVSSRVADGSQGEVFGAISAACLLAACLAGEMLERYQFFAACATARMPGSLP